MLIRAMRVSRQAAVGACLAGLILPLGPSDAFGQGATGPPTAAEPVALLIQRVGERLRLYYDRVTSVACTETVVQQELSSSLTPRGKARQFVYELVVTREAARAGSRAPDVKAERQVMFIDGRPPAVPGPPACTDPQPAFTDPLMFLLPERRGGYRFMAAPASETVPGLVVVDFVQVEAEPTRVTWQGGCFTADGGRAAGRIWIDPTTHDVLQLETRLAEPFTIDLPDDLPRPGPSFLTVQQSHEVVRFRPVVFQDPDETFLLPESIVTITVIPNARVPRLRTAQTFTNFMRFMTDARVRGID